MQVDLDTATVMAVTRPDGGALTLDPGRQVVARVLEVRPGGEARISLAGQSVSVRTDAPVRVGDDLRLTVARSDETGVRLVITPPERNVAVALTPNPGPGGPGVGGGGSLAPIVDELARAGVPVSPRLVQVAQLVADELGGGSTAARAVAVLASRDIALSPAAAGRVAAALDLAGSIGPTLASLAERSPAVAAALPSGAPNAAALRSLLAPGLSDAELAVARIVQAQAASQGAQAAAPGGPVTVPTPPSSSPSVIRSYVASQVAGMAALDVLAEPNSVLGAAQLATARGATTGTVAPAAPGTLTAAALDAALRGTAGAPAAVVLGDDAAALAARDGRGAGAGAGAGALGAPPLAPGVRAGATAAAATGAATATPTPTSGRVAQAVADLGALAARVAVSTAPALGAMGDAAAQAARGTNAAQLAQAAGRDGALAARGASVAGASASSDPAPLITALRTFLASPQAEGDTQRLLQAIGGSSTTALATALRTLPEPQALAVAGALLDALPDRAGLSAPALADLRAGVHRALDDLGRALAAPAGNDTTALRAVLEQVAATDPRPVVAQDAARLLAALDGQAIISRTASGADPGYVYFQVPMPDGRGAEVLVRRDPGRRAVSFDEFDIAFLLDTEHLGTLMIHLDANPAGIRADVKTDVAVLEPFLREHGEALVEPLAREARRPVVLTTGVFDDRAGEPAPTSLLEPRLGLVPGSTEFYV